MIVEERYRELLERWIYDDLTDDEVAQLPEELKALVQAYFQGLVDEAIADVEAGRLVDGPSAMARMREDLQARYS